MNEPISSQGAELRLREVAQSLAEAIESRDGEAAQNLAKRYEQALREALSYDTPQRDALMREAYDWLQQKIEAARQIQAEMAGEIKEIEAKRKLMGNSVAGSAKGDSCSFVV